jgi:hypothetical protein
MHLLIRTLITMLYLKRSFAQLSGPLTTLLGNAGPTRTQPLKKIQIQL